MAQILRRKDVINEGLNPDAATVETSTTDSYETPAWMVAPLLQVVNLHPGVVVEPCCGPGSLARELRRLLPPLTSVIASDIRRNLGYGLGGVDFLSTPSPYPLAGTGVTWVVTNPPYKIGIEIIERALQVARVGVAMLLPLDWLGSRKRYKRLWNRHEFAGSLAFSRPGDFYPEGRPEKRNGGQLFHQWAVWLQPEYHTTTHPWLRFTDAEVDLTHDTRLGIESVRQGRKKKS